MRLAVFVFSTIFLFAQTNAYAVNLEKVVSYNKLGALVRYGKAGFKFIKKNPLVGIGVYIGAYCIEHPSFCADVLTGKYNPDDDKEEDKEEDKTKNKCIAGLGPEHLQPKEYIDYLNKNRVNSYYAYDATEETYQVLNNYLKEYINYYENKKDFNEKGWYYAASSKDFPVNSYDIEYGKQSGHRVITTFSLYVKCNEKPSDEQKLEQTINNMSDDDIVNFINEAGDTFIDKLCVNFSCNIIEDEDQKPTDTYDIVERNGQICVLKNNEVLKCIAKTKEEKHKEKEKEEPEPKKELFCDTNAFYKKICDWIDWTQKDDVTNDDTKVTVKEKDLDENYKKDRLHFAKACPPDKTFSMSYAGATFNPKISYEWLCKGMMMLKPFIIGLSGISAALIISGGFRGR